MATDASAFVLPVVPSPNTKRKKSFLAEEEDIVVKPSPELIPDEYEHSTNEDVQVHIFKNSIEEDLAEDLLKSLQDINYKVDASTNIHDMNTEKEFMKDLENIRRESFNKSALLLVFIGFFHSNQDSGTLLMIKEKTSVHMKEVWSLFSAYNCPELKNKPKIFIFCTSLEPPVGVQTDSKRHRTMDFETVYDFPAESDILIVYKQVNDVMPSNKEQFLRQLCWNIEQYSKKYDIIDLISYIHNNHKFVPLIVSTLTRKFYLTPSGERGHYLSMIENHSILEESLKKIQEDVQKLHEVQKKKKDKKFSFSFRKKSEERPKIVAKKNEAREQARISKTMTVPTNPKTRLSTSSSVGTRSRNQSQSETDSNATNRKPIWRI